ncbi:two-component system histidine kinase [Amycolatopsis mediterranei S699]|uniref:histidine kinase n=3 Tax=Amycolatopsis mediterranei TaxID=33910 RepID=A0A0H3D535_AMYMU|nr:HAMP domain-containing sensor histidine kinase [Amycolatopsis mediterranei]ADJ45367.1 two-component system histidine kinase [Amycolatopsis mediterranei U32]AEK42128.1 two-component system histidine kinase [Amycolatopsis mediterranei S699]AFO77078.1 two-component system histidine kinase [Amycolatopsis mediterranei S699]AGT84206.1 two-component system histidine kinase [Amycolatopsis mediterranei RB]KDO05943.1 histidine kinase [Amycolatopsis mediterranei]
MSLRTASLRRRVTVTVLVVLAVVLVAVGLVVDAAFRAQAERDVNTVLTTRVQLAQQLAKQNVSPPNLVRRVETRGVTGSLSLPDGTFVGAAPLPADARIRQVHATLSGPPRINGAKLTLTADESLIAAAERSLRWVLLATGVAALAVAAVALLLAVRFALAPLDAMTRLARSIVSGERGGRLAPERTGTELGRAAAAFDSALDALEGAEGAARASEERTRRFVADAAHELRTPLAGVQAAAEALLQQPADTPHEHRERLQLLVVRESQRAGKLVADLLDLARLDSGAELERAPVSLRELAEAQAEQVRLTAPEVTVEVIGADTTVLGDRVRLTQILANLTGNAVRAMDGRGTLTLEVTGDGVTVTDTGPGVPGTERERIFDRLVRLDAARSQAGAGLGLPIARGFARAHGGDLWCEAAPGGGARFRLAGLPTVP